MIHISLRNKARHTREPGSVVIILMKIPHVRASFDSFHPGKMFVTHFPTENALMPFYLGYKKVEWKKRGGTREKKRENRLLVEYRLAPCTTTKTCTTYIHTYIYISILLQEFQTALRNTETKGSYKNFYMSLQEENSFPRFHES